MRIDVPAAVAVCDRAAAATFNAHDARGAGAKIGVKLAKLWEGATHSELDRSLELLAVERDRAGRSENRELLDAAIESIREAQKGIR